MPFLPPEIKGLRMWLKPPPLEFKADGDPAEFWPDESGSDFNAEQVSPGIEPTFALQAAAGFPALEFNGVDQFMNGASMDDIVGTGPKCMFLSFNVPDVSFDQALIYDTNGQVQLKIIGGSPLGQIRSVQSGDQATMPIAAGIHTAFYQVFGLAIHIALDSPWAFDSAPTGASGSLGSMLLGVNDSGGDFFAGQMIELITYGGAGVMKEREASKIMAYMMKATGRGDPLGIGRDTISRRMRANQRSRMFLTVDAPLSFLDSDILKPHALTHREIPDTNGQGSGLLPWQRRVANLMERVETPSQYRLSLGMADRKRVGHMYAEGGVPDYTHDARREGVPISGMGVRRIYFHQTRLFIEAPSGIVQEVRGGLEPGTAHGIFGDPATNNYLLRSSFISGLTGLTVTGDGTNGSDATAVENGPGIPFLFGTQRDLTAPGNAFPLIPITEFHLKLLAGTPHAADLIVEWPPTTGDELIQADEKLCFSIDHLDLIGPGFWALQNDVDSKYWDDAGEAWSVTIVWNELPFRDGIKFRDRSNVIAWPSGTGQATLFLGMPNTLATDGASYEVFHVQLEAFGFPTSRWVQDNVFVGPRGEQRLFWFENALAKMFNEPAFTVAMRITPPWNAADLEAGKSTVPGGWNVPIWMEQYASLATDHYWRGGINGSLGAGLTRWELSAKAGSEVFAYENTQKPQRGVEIPVIWRCTSATGGELGLPANTMDVFANHVKGVSAQVVTRPTTIVNSRFVTGLLGAYIRDIEMDFRVWPDSECEAW